MVRFIALVIALLAPFAAFAADGAQQRAIGYSGDQKYFAFEQFGIQDGSGFSYSDIFVLDITKDAWVPGTPIRVMVDDEGVKLRVARDKAMAQAKPILDKLDIRDAVETLAMQPFTEMGGNRQLMRFGRFFMMMGVSTEHFPSFELAVKEIALSVPADCTDTDIAVPKGFELTLRNAKTGVSKVLSKDTSIPASRFCAHAYDLEAVYSPMSFAAGPDPLIAIIGVMSRGFEGADRHYIAVPFELFE